MKWYRVLFLIKKGGFRYYFIDVQAENKANAVNIVKELWESEHSSHQFHITCKPLKTNVVAEHFARLSDYPEVEDWYAR